MKTIPYLNHSVENSAAQDRAAEPRKGKIKSISGRNLKYLSLTLISPILLSLQASCASTPEYHSVQAIYNSGQCGIEEEGIISLESEGEFSKIVNHGFRPTRQDMPSPDFSLHRVVAISMGMKSTAGYALSLKSDTFQVNNETANLNIEIRQPKEGSMTAQMMTSPCIILAMDKGNYSKIVAGPYSLQ